MSLVSNVFNTSSYKPKEKKKGGLERFADTISAPFEAVGSVLGLPDVVGTLAKPFVETYAGVQQLRGKETSRWVKEHGLQTPETAALMTKGATDENLGALIKDKKAAGYKGAGVTDILNVASLAPGLGTFAKGTKALGSASKVATGAERFLPTLGKTLKETVPAGAAWGGAYGAAGAFDQGGSIGDIGEGALVDGLTGAAVGGGLGLAGAGIGSLANKASRLVNKDLRVKGISESNLRGLTQIEDNNAVVRKAVDKYRKQGIDAKKLLAQTDLLVGAVDDTGTLRTTQEGGAVSQLQEFIRPQESVVSDILKREGKVVSLKDVEKKMIANLDASNITGEDLITAQNKIKKEIAGLRRRADKDGNIPMWLVQDAKTYKYGNIDYMKPSSKNTDKLIARTFKEIVESGTESADIRALNKELQAHYSVLGLLERLDGKKVQGGKLGKYFAQTVGSIVGSHFGPLGSIVGAELGGRIRGSQLKSQFNKASGKGMERSQVLLDAMDLAQKPKPTPEIIPESRRLSAPAIVTPPPADTSRLFTQEEARAYLGESARPKSRSMLQLGAPDVKTPMRDTSGLLSQEEARARLRSYGVTIEDISPQSSNNLGSLNTSQSKTTTPTSIGISKSVAEKPKVDINSVESLDAEISRRVEKFRSEAGIVAQREGAGVRTRTTDTGIDAADERTFTSFSLNQAKGTMKAQADSAKKYAQTMLYENDPEFRSIVDVRDALLETKIVEAKTIPEVEAVFKMADKEEQVIIKESKQYAQANPLTETPSTPKEDQGNGLSKEKGAVQVASSPKALKAQNKKAFDDAMMKDVSDFYKEKPSDPLLSEAKKYKTADEFVKAQGEPLYHGTNADFEVFDKNKIGSATDPGLFGRGFYFGNTESFARIAPAGRLAKNVMEVYPLSRNLFDISKIKSKEEMAELLGMSEHALTQDSNGIVRPKMDQIGQFTSHVEDLGYDGVVVKRGGDAIETVIFDSENLKTKSQLLDIYKKAHGDKLGKLSKK